MRGIKVRISSEVENFISSLEEATIAKILRTIDLLVRFGHQLGQPHSKKIQNNLFELRIKGKQEVRIFYCFIRNKAILVHGFIKKKQKTPIKEIKIAVKRVVYL